jgi:hypothetical protein
VALVQAPEFKSPSPEKQKQTIHKNMNAQKKLYVTDCDFLQVDVLSFFFSDLYLQNYI